MPSIFIILSSFQHPCPQQISSQMIIQTITLHNICLLPFQTFFGKRVPTELHDGRTTRMESTQIRRQGATTRLATRRCAPDLSSPGGFQRPLNLCPPCTEAPVDLQLVKDNMGLQETTSWPREAKMETVGSTFAGSENSDLLHGVGKIEPLEHLIGSLGLFFETQSLLRMR